MEAMSAETADILSKPIDTKKLLAAKALNASEAGLLLDFMSEAESERQTMWEEVRVSPLSFAVCLLALFDPRVCLFSVGHRVGRALCQVGI